MASDLRPPPLPARQSRRRLSTRTVWAVTALAALLVLFGVGWLLWPDHDENSLDELMPLLARAPRSSGFEAAKEALLNAGTNALPVIRKNLNARNNRIQEWYRLKGTNLPGVMRSKLTPLLDPYLNANRRTGAARAVGLLGTNAAPLLPELLSAFAENDPAVGYVQTEALVALGELVVPPMIEMLRIEPLETKRRVVFVLHQLGPAATSAIPAVIDELSRTDDAGYEAQLRDVLHRIGGYAGGRATMTYEMTAGDPHNVLNNTVPVVIPALLAMLETGDPRTQIRALHALRDGHAPSLVLALKLLPFLKSEHAQVRTGAALSIARAWPMQTWRLRVALDGGRLDGTPVWAGAQLIEEEKETIAELLDAWLKQVGPGGPQDARLISSINWSAYATPSVRRTLEELAAGHRDQTIRGVANGAVQRLDRDQ